MIHKKYSRALTIAGSDSGGGAGIQADLKTFSALGVYGMSVITALTAQNTMTVKSIYEVTPQFVGDQLEAIFSDLGTDAVKIGMLLNPEIINVVVKSLKENRPKWTVLDPVMVAKSGDKLLREDAILSLKKELIPLADILTPNLPEAEVLLGKPIENRKQMEEAALELLKLGTKAVLIKGGHLDSNESGDCLRFKTNDSISAPLWIEGKRIQTKNTHGTGCTLSSAITALLAKGYGLEEAIRHAKDYLTSAILAGSVYQIGQGHGPVHHFWNVWD